MNPFIINIKKDLSYHESFDVTIKQVDTVWHTYTLVFLNFLCSHDALVDIMFAIRQYDEESFNLKTLSKVVLNESTTVQTNYEAIYNDILNGNVAIFNEEEGALICEVKQYPSRSISEPDSEKVVRGSRDGFTENIATNIGLIRRRAKTGELKIIKYEIGKISKTLVALVYIEGCIKEKYLNCVKKRLEAVEIEELTMADKALEELMLKNRYTPYPLVKYTERPDTFCSHLYQGMFGILVDTSPSAMLGPISLFDHMQHAEEFRQSILSGSYLRFIRFMGIVLSFLSIPIWYTLLEYNISLNSFFGNFFTVPFDKTAVFFQLIIMELGVEFIRMASIHTPTALSTSMGIIAGIVIGEMAIDIGILSQQVVLLGAISAIGSYITPSYELSLANKIAKIFVITMIFFFDVYGLVISLAMLIIYLMMLKSFERPYLYPLIPFNWTDFKRQIFRAPFATKNRHNKKSRK